MRKRIAEEVPPPGVLYYKYKSNESSNSAPIKTSTNTERLIANRQVVETDNKNLVKIRFSDLPISKATANGLHKAKFVKMTEV